VLVAAMAAAAVAGILHGSNAAAQIGTSTLLRISLDGRIEAPAAPFLFALERGHYRSEGLDVRFEPAPDFLTPINRVAAGTYEIGFADINALIRLHGHNPAPPVKAVFMVYNKAPYAVTARKSRGVAKPQDLEGKKLAMPEADPSFPQWPLFAKLSGIDASKVAVEKVGIPVREPMLAAGQVDAVLGSSFASYVDLKARGVPVDDVIMLPMADYGLVLYGNAILVNTRFAAEHPEVVRGFLRAFVKGLKETIRDPTHAIEPVLERNEGADREVELERLRMVVRDNIVTPEAKADGFGTVDTARFEAGIDQIGLTFKFKSRPALADVFDLSFLPSAIERKFY
jgi:NitT/TauT family transport system substrate-binding protein